jgi:hypothetical protein
MADRSKIADVLWPAGLPHGMTVWAVLDGARDPRIFGAVEDSRTDRCCLYSGDLPWQLQMAAPYLVKLDRDLAFTRRLIDDGWGRSWGIFLRTETGMKQLRRHLHGLLVARNERGERLVFRWYDPRVLRVYLPTCWPAELNTVFGPINSFALENDKADRMLEYRFGGRELLVERHSVAARNSAEVASC